jgi:hypothetical protein
MITVETIDKIEEDLTNLFDVLEDLLENSPEKINKELSDAFIGFNACIDEFYASRAAKIADELYDRFGLDD